MNSKPNNALVSVLLPVRNSAKFLSACLDSLLLQNYSGLEIIAIDDNSSDNSWRILREYQKRHKQLNIFKNVKQYGLALTLNRCLKRIKGTYILFMDARDTITKNKIQKQVDYLHSNAKVVAVGTQCIYINELDKRTGKSNFPLFDTAISEKPLHGISVLFEGIMIHRHRIPKDLLYFNSRKNTFLYSDMAMKLMQYGELANISEYLHFHRKHTTNASMNMLALLQLWLKSKFEYGITPSFRSFFGISLFP